MERCLPLLLGSGRKIRCNGSTITFPGVIYSGMLMCFGSADPRGLQHGLRWAFPIKHPIRSSRSSVVPLPPVGTPKIDAARALQPDLMPHLSTSAPVPPQEDIPFSGTPPRPALQAALSNRSTITACKRGLKHMSAVTFTLV